MIDPWTAGALLSGIVGFVVFIVLATIGVRTPPLRRFVWMTPQGVFFLEARDLETALEKVSAYEVARGRASEQTVLDWDGSLREITDSI